MNTSHWSWCQSGKEDPGWNMAADDALLEGASTWTSPILRFYGWTQAAASFGYFQHYSEIEKVTALRPLVRRPTAGGLVPHDADWTYSLLFPAGHPWYALRAEESYRRLHEWVRDSFTRLGVATELSPCCAKELPGQCFAGPEKFDLLMNGLKIAGAAQRRTRHGLLIQGSIQRQPPSVSRAHWEDSFRAAASEQWGVQWVAFASEAEWRSRTDSLYQQRYSQESFHRKR